MICEMIHARLDAYRTGELPPDEAAVVTTHLRACAGCTALLADLRALAGAAPALRTTLPATVARAVLARTGDAFGMVETALGPVWVGFSPRGITLIHVGEEEPAGFAERYARRRRRPARPAAVPERYAAAVRAAAAGETARPAPLDLSGLGEFEQAVLPLLAGIPRGQVRTYAWLAAAAGRPRASRAIGNAMARNPVPLLLPCHRVVPSGGGIGRYAFSSAVKRALLQREGVPLADLENLARRGVRYLGCRGTGIYCLPTCRAIQRARPENRMPFASPAAAEAAGYRACRQCRPVPLAS